MNFTELNIDKEAIKRLQLAVRTKDNVQGLTHNYYRYPARFSPKFVREVIEIFSKPGDVILDPFVGGGTTLVEALVMIILHDDYLKWVCGFANAQGGIIFIGKDDNGNVVGVAEYKKLMDDIPNKIRNTMGITAEVNLHEEQGKHFIEIVTHSYSVPISVRGRY